jgi:large subunit ribosomal protein L20
MPRVKRGLMTHKRHKNLIAKVKGFRMMNNNVFSRAKNALAKAGQNAYTGRKQKKRNFRELWNARINNAVRPLGMTYSTFIGAMNAKRVSLNRKVLSNLAISHPQVFEKVVAFVK